MDELIKSIVSTYNVSESTAKTYAQNYNKMKKLLPKIEDLKNPNKILKILEKKSLNTQKLAIISVAKVLLLMGKINDDEATKLYKSFFKISGKVDKQQQNKPISPPDIDINHKINITKEAIKNTNDNIIKSQLYQDLIVYYIYSILEPRRGKDYYDMRITNHKTPLIKKSNNFKNNYFNGNYFIFKDYKTFSTYGVKSIKLPSIIKTTINKLIKLRQSFGEDSHFLFLNSSLKPFNQSGWSKYVARLFDGAGIGDIRRLYAEENVNQSAVKNAIQTANKMGHSLNTAINY